MPEQEATIITWEYFYKPFNARGDNDYLHAWALEVDDMAAHGWNVLDCVRQTRQPPQARLAAASVDHAPRRRLIP